MLHHVLGCNPSALGTFILWACLVLPPHEVTEDPGSVLPWKQKGCPAVGTTTFPSAPGSWGRDETHLSQEGEDGMCGSCVRQWLRARALMVWFSVISLVQPPLPFLSLRFPHGLPYPHLWFSISRRNLELRLVFCLQSNCALSNQAVWTNTCPDKTLRLLGKYLGICFSQCTTYSTTLKSIHPGVLHTGCSDISD